MGYAATMPLPVLAFAGSLRKASFNRKLCTLAVGHARAQGAEVDHLDLAEVTMPLYDGDLEAASGLPAGADELRRRVARARVVLLASPEYNTSIPGVLKNAIDWSSRGPAQPWPGKVVLMMAASPGMAGGGRMLPDLRKVLSTLGALVLPHQVTIAKAHEAFDEHGQLKLESLAKDLEKAVTEALRMAEKLG
jgi:chromate reductase